MVPEAEILSVGSARSAALILPVTLIGTGDEPNGRTFHGGQEH